MFKSGLYIMIARRRAGMTQQELADRMYYNHAVIGAWENGKKEPSKEAADKLREILPELKEIELTGCEHLCKQPRPCLGGGKCKYKGKKTPEEYTYR